MTDHAESVTYGEGCLQAGFWVAPDVTHKVKIIGEQDQLLGQYSITVKQRTSAYFPNSCDSLIERLQNPSNEFKQPSIIKELSQAITYGPTLRNKQEYYKIAPRESENSLVQKAYDQDVGVPTFTRYIDSLFSYQHLSV